MRRLALLLGSTVVALLVAESGLRLFAADAFPARSRRPLTGWESEEYRQFDPAAERSAPGRRILVLGDSFLAKPAGPEPDRRFPTLLAGRLGERATFRTLASQGWGTDQELLAFLEKGKAWAPDVVRLAFCANNDISNNCSHDHGPKQLKPYFVLESDGGLSLHDGEGAPLDLQALFGNSPWRSRLLDRLGAALRSGPAAGRAGDGDYPAVDPRYKRFESVEEHPDQIYARQRKLSWSPQAGVNDASAYVHEDFEINAYQWRLLEALLARPDAEVRGAGGRLVVLLLPVIFDPQNAETIAGGSFEQSFATPAGSFTFRSAEPRDRLAAITSRLGIAFADPTPEFIRRVLDEELMPQVWPDPRDRHFSAKGHELLADYFERHPELIGIGP